MNYITLTPAYGRDYKSKADIAADLAADKDFLLDGRPINRPQLIEAGYSQVNVRYKALRQITVIKIK